MTATGPKDVRAILRNLEDAGLRRTMDQVRRSYRLTETELLGTDRHKRAAAARRYLWMLIKHTLDLSYPEIAKIFQVDHTTVLAAVRKAERERGFLEVA